MKHKFSTVDEALQFCLDRITEDRAELSRLNRIIAVLKENNEALVYRFDRLKKENEQLKASLDSTTDYVDMKMDRMDIKLEKHWSAIEKLQGVHGR